LKRRSLPALAAEITACRRCPRLVGWRERVALEKRRAYRDETYWGRPVPGFGDPAARLVVVGLAPAAHGANRTGRMFTGDRSGDFLYAALFRAALASHPESRRRDDGQTLTGVYITAPCRCAPPDNKPTPEELAACRPFLDREIALLASARVFLALGAIGYHAVREIAGSRPREVPPFGHGVEATVTIGGRAAVVVASYHVSQQNTQTGRLTEAMFDAVLARALSLAS
jgi:uracil-DNA glycosylase